MTQLVEKTDLTRHDVMDAIAKKVGVRRLLAEADKQQMGRAVQIAQDWASPHS
ncbi:hypothetical protein [Streptomyces sp. NBC_01518]|uniref:hypothetical protein n=1 Tax=Streptomyces sp. NBC_01518 TaxID=2903891 RepID=UPI0038658EF3